MPALSSGDQTTWRSAPYSIRTDVFVHAPTTVFAARVNQASFTYPLTSLTFDTVTTGAYTDIEEGMLVLIGSTAGTDDLGRVRARKTLAGTVASSTVLYIQRSSQGTGDGELNPADNAYITVLNLRKPWSIAPYIDDDGVTYIDTDKTFTNDRSYPPVANGDPDVLMVVRDGSTSVSLSFGNVSAIVMNPEASLTLTHAWTFHSTCTPSTSTSATPSVTVPVNTVFYAKHVVTDDQGTAATHYSLVAVVDAAHSGLRNCRITSHTARPEGQQIQLEFAEALPYSTYPDGTEVLIAKREQFGATSANLAGVTDRKQMIFSGWIYEEETEGRATEYGFQGRATITCTDAAGWLAVLPGYPTIVERESSPTRWEHMKEANINRYVHRILWAYSNILTRACFVDNVEGALQFPTLGSDGMSLYEQADQRSQAVACKLTCDKHNRLVIKVDPQLQNTGTRTSTVIVPILERDWRLYRYRYTRPPRTHWNWGEAIGAQGIDAADIGEVTTYFCVAPGEAPGQGLGNQTSGQQLVINQTVLNEREGHRYATRMNSRYGYVEVTLRGGDAGIEPALMEWVRFEVTANTAGPRGRTFSTTTDRFLPIEVNYDYDHEGSVRVARVTIEKETVGTPAVTYFPPQDNYPGQPFPVNPYPDPIIQFPDDTYPEDWYLRSGANRIALICKNGLARTTNFGSGAATTWDYQAWVDFSPSENTSLVGDGAYTAVPDAFTYGTAAVKCWVLLAKPTTKIYYLDVTNRTWTLKHSFSGSYSIVLNGLESFNGGADASFGTQNHFVATCYVKSVGTQSVYTTDNSTFTEVNLTTTTNTAINSIIKSPSVFVSPRTAGKVITSIHKTVSGLDVVAKTSTDYGATWSDGATLADWGAGNATAQARSLHVPYDAARNSGETIFFYGTEYSGSSAAYLMRSNGGSLSAIYSSYVQIEATRNGISTYVADANRLLFCGASNYAGTGTYAAYVTANALAASPSWTALTTPEEYMHCAIAGDSGATFYFWGGNYGTVPAVGYSIDSGATVISQTGNLGSFSPGAVQMLVGW